MSVVNIKSSLLSNFDAQPRIASSADQAAAGDTISIAVVAIGATDSPGSTYRFGFVPSGVRMQDIQIQNDALAGGGTYQLGVYCNTQQTCRSTTGGVVTKTPPGIVPVPNAQLIFNTTISAVGPGLAWSSVYSPNILNTVSGAANTRLRVWELLGFDQDPSYEFHLALTSTSTVSLAGSIALQWSWCR